MECVECEYVLDPREEAECGMGETNGTCPCCGGEIFKD